MNSPITISRATDFSAGCRCRTLAALSLAPEHDHDYLCSPPDDHFYDYPYDYPYDDPHPNPDSQRGKYADLQGGTARRTGL